MFKDVGKLASAVLDDIEVNVYVKTVDHRFLYINPATSKTFQATIDQVVGRLDIDILPRAVAEHWRVLDERVFATGVKQQGEETFVEPDGRIRYFWSTKVLLQGPGADRCVLGYSTDITKLKEAELSLRQTNDALRQSEELFRRAFDGANTGMSIVDLQGRLIQVNDKMTEIFGFSESELISMTVNDLAIEEDKGKSPAFMSGAVRGDADKGVFEKRYRHRDGHLVHGVVSSALMHDAAGSPAFFVSQIQDITRAKQLELALQTSEQRHRLLLENASDILWSMRGDGTFRFFNRSVEALLGYAEEDALKMKMEQFLAPDSIPIANAYLARVQAAIEAHEDPPSFHGDLLQRRKDGSFVWTDVYAYPIRDEQGNLTEILGLSRNIESQKQHELHLQQARDEAEAAKSALEAANMALAASNAALESANAKLKDLASTDVLTNATNRRQFEIILADHIALARRQGTPMSLIMYDLDNFKDINDSFGHHRGDEVLKTLATLVQEALRKGDVFGRWGGEEFLILLPLCNSENGRAIADNIRERFASYAFPGIGHVTASFGVAQWDPDESDTDWLVRVDQAMYEAKDAGRNAVRIL